MSPSSTRDVYSALLAVAQNIGDTPLKIGTPPDGYLWIVRFAAATFGSYAAYVNCSLCLNNEDPRLWLMSSQVGNYFSDHPVTFFWEGRMVVPAATDLYAQASQGDECDIYVSGYQLSTP